jgi:hypothetical protein
MNNQSIRGGLAIANVALTVSVVALGYVTFFTRHVPPPGDSVPSYSPVKLALPAQARSQDPLAEYSVVWQSLEKPPPPPPPPAPVNVAPAAPTRTDLEAIFKLVLVALHPEDPKLNSCILEPRQGGEQIVLGVGDKWSGYECTSIDQRMDGAAQVCVVNLKDPNGQTAPVRLKRTE